MVGPFSVVRGIPQYVAGRRSVQTKLQQIHWADSSTVPPPPAYYCAETLERDKAGGPVVLEKRKLMVVGAAIAAVFTVAGCAPSGIKQTPAADYGNAAAPAAQPNA